MRIPVSAAVVTLMLISFVPTALSQASGSFVATGSMTTPRLAHTATLLKDGRVLIAGGFLYVNSNGFPVALESAELYDPSTGSFSPAGSMITARAHHTATLLPDGRVLIAGGFQYTVAPRSTYLTNAELYDPAAGTFTATESMIEAQGSDTATLLDTGKVLISGGFCGCPNPHARAELYDPAT